MDIIWPKGTLFLFLFLWLAELQGHGVQLGGQLDGCCSMPIVDWICC
jgi:hypothetical protein